MRSCQSDRRKRDRNHQPIALGIVVVISKVLNSLYRIVARALAVKLLLLLRPMPQNLANEEPALVQAMAWDRQATSHYLNQSWPRSMSPYNVTMPQAKTIFKTLHWRHIGCGSVLNHQPHDCLLNHLFRRRSKKTSKLRVTGLCAGNSPGTGEFPAQMSSKAENVSIWWRHLEDTQ